MSLWKLLQQVVGQSAIFLSILSFVVQVHPDHKQWSLLEFWTLFSSGLLILCLIIVEIQEYFQNRKIWLSNSSEIANYMFTWINSHGRVAIFSRDMSWATSKKIKEMLIRKAKKDELNIFVPKKSEFIDSLQKQGAHIFDYPNFPYTPLSRFTIVDYGRSDARLAVGRKILGRHLVEEFSNEQHPVFAVANDLLKMVEEFSKKGKS